MYNPLDMHENKARDVLAALRHFNRLQDPIAITSMLEKSANTIETLLMSKQEMIIHISYLEGILRGAGFDVQFVFDEEDEEEMRQ